MGTGVAGVGERNNNLREREQCQLVCGPLPLLYFLTVVPPLPTSTTSSTTFH